MKQKKFREEGAVFPGNRTECAGRGANVAIWMFVGYSLLLAVAAASEIFGLSWFNHPIFK